MSDRYSNRKIVTNNNSMYEEIIKDRNLNFVNHYMTPKFKYPTIEQRKDLIVSQHVWVTGDRFYKLADKYYDDPKYWWVISWYNQTPLESDVKLGDVLNIPLPLDKVLEIFY